MKDNTRTRYCPFVAACEDFTVLKGFRTHERIVKAPYTGTQKILEKPAFPEDLLRSLNYLDMDRPTQHSQRSFLHRFRQCWMRMHRNSDILARTTELHCEHHFGKQIRRIWPNDMAP